MLQGMTQKSVYCSVSYCVAACCSVLQCVAVCTRHELRFTGNLNNSREICNSVEFGEIRNLLDTATRCNTLQHKATHYVHHLSVNRYMDEFIHTMIYIHIHIYVAISTYERCIASRVARLKRYLFMYVFVMSSCVHALVCVCACVGVWVFCRCFFHCRCADPSEHVCVGV